MDELIPKPSLQEVYSDCWELIKEMEFHIASQAWWRSSRLLYPSPKEFIRCYVEICDDFIREGKPSYGRGWQWYKDKFLSKDFRLYVAGMYGAM